MPRRIPKRCLPGEQGGFSEVTGGRAPSFHDLSMGETAAIPKGGMGRGQNSPVDKSSEKTSPGASERKKSLPVPKKSSRSPIHPRCPAKDVGHAQFYDGGTEQPRNSSVNPIS
jgi:hypothetical protein